MADSVLDLLTQALGSGGTRQIGQQLGLDEGAAAKIGGGLLGSLLGGRR